MKPIKRAIIICWIMLLACFVMKIFGGNWFEIVCTNEHFIKACKIIDENKFLWCVVGILTYVSSSTLIIFGCSKTESKTKSRGFYIVVICLSLCWSTQFISTTFKSIVEVLAIMILPLVISIIGETDKITKIKNIWYRGIICVFVTFGFQAISFITRNIGIVIVDDSTMKSLILLIDYYIMAFLFYLYSKLSKKEN